MAHNPRCTTVEAHSDDGCSTNIDEPLRGFADSNSKLFYEYVRGWYEPEQAEKIIAEFNASYAPGEV